jgi:hypothetical protein
MIAEKAMPKTWKAGTADEVWKVMICARDAYETEKAISFLSYILTDCGADLAKGLAKIRKMTGEQIVNALIDHVEVSRRSVENALRGGPQ